MLTDKVLGAYAAIATLPAAQQAEWYRRAAGDWGIDTFEIPILAGQPLAPELVEVFTELPAALVVTLVAQWAGRGQEHPAYGLAAPEGADRRTALLDAYSALQHCAELSRQGIRVRNLAVHTGCRSGDPIAHAISFHRSLVELRQHTAAVLSDTTLCVELTDHRPLDYPVAFPAAKKASLTTDELVQTVAAVNRQTLAGPPIHLLVNWGRLLVNGDRPQVQLDRLLRSEVPLAGVILSGAGASPEGFTDSHNSHLDPESGFTPADAQACARALSDHVSIFSDSVPPLFHPRCTTR
ncbi:MAG: DUF4862 family protein [Candidatus Latescibacteria bacterium]|nr:DUF4862 family protein [Candidatus Latescibacterota bacterium]